MLLHSYKITRILPCLADPEKTRVIAELSDEIHEIFPYLNATLKGCIYNHPALTLTIKKDEKLITLHFRYVTLTMINDENEAEEILRCLKDLINETYENRNKIEPNYSGDEELRSTDIYKLLPGTNCKKCGEIKCFSFAFKLAKRETIIAKCSPLFSQENQEKRKVLFELLHAAGYDVPVEYLET